MNVSGEQLAQIASLFLEKDINRVLIFIPPQAKLDTCAAGLAWKKVLELQQKEVSIVSALKPSFEEGGLSGTEVITQELGGDNLIIHFPYQPEQVDKITSHIGEQTNRFYLTIKPKNGVKPISLEEVEIGYAGASADALVLLDVNSSDQLEPYFTEFPDLFRNTPSLVVSQYGLPEIGVVKLETQGAASLSEESTHLFLQLGWEIESNAATALLRGIEECTQWLASPVATANTFEAVAALLRAGAKRQRRPSKNNSSITTGQNTDSTNFAQPLNFGPIIQNNSNRPQFNQPISDESSVNSTKFQSSSTQSAGSNPLIKNNPLQSQPGQPFKAESSIDFNNSQSRTNQLKAFDSDFESELRTEAVREYQKSLKNLDEARGESEASGSSRHKTATAVLGSIPSESPSSTPAPSISTTHSLAEVLRQKQNELQTLSGKSGQYESSTLSQNTPQPDLSAWPKEIINDDFINSYDQLDRFEKSDLPDKSFQPQQENLEDQALKKNQAQESFSGASINQNYKEDMELSSSKSDFSAKQTAIENFQQSDLLTSNNPKIPSSEVLAQNPSTKQVRNQNDSSTQQKSIQNQILTSAQPEKASRSKKNGGHYLRQKNKFMRRRRKSASSTGRYMGRKKYTNKA